jgi:hypothetical protein
VSPSLAPYAAAPDPAAAATLRRDSCDAHAPTEFGSDSPSPGVNRRSRFQELGRSGSSLTRPLLSSMDTFVWPLWWKGSPRCVLLVKKPNDVVALDVLRSLARWLLDVRGLPIAVLQDSLADVPGASLFDPRRAAPA